MKLFTHYLTEKQILKLKSESKKTGLTVSEILRRTIDKYFDKK